MNVEGVALAEEALMLLNCLNDLVKPLRRTLRALIPRITGVV